MAGRDHHGGVEARRITVTGGVQGVGYRAWAVGTATALGLDGWVRNRWDGSVEMVAQGDTETLQALIEACRRGPSMARVDDVRTEAAPGLTAPGFRAKPTV